MRPYSIPIGTMKQKIISAYSRKIHFDGDDMIINDKTEVFANEK